MSERPTDLEQQIRAHFDAGRLEAAATATLEGYGDEILSFLVARLRSASDAQEAFSMFAENLWTGLPGFGWRCSMRTWAYLIARNASTRIATQPQRRWARNLELSKVAGFVELIDRVRTATNAFQQTAVKDRFRALREQLDDEDQMLLVLRVDREMSWRDLAITIAGDEHMDDEAVTREAARLRKAFERVKRQLRELAERDGLLKPTQE